ncbi:MAG: glycosyltransferase [Clostridium sp.]|nr:glycosyltransferase [Clostridium sp.]
MRKVCCIFNFAPHYRKAIYQLMDRELKCDFYFGDHAETKIQAMDVSALKGFKGNVRNKRLFSHFYWQRGILRLLNKPYDSFILTGEVYNLSLWVFLLMARLKRKQTFLWSHGWYGKENKWRKLLKKAIFRQANGMLLYGEYARKLMIENGFDPQRLFCIANSLDYDNQKIIRNRLTHTGIYRQLFGNDYPTCIYVGRIQPVKRIDLLIRAIALMEQQGLGLCNLLIVGDGENRKALEAVANEVRINNRVHFYGSCYDETRLAEIFYNATACVSPGNVGLTALHALSFGCPVITHNTFSEQMPEFEVITEHQTGAFFQKDSVEDLARAISQWIREAPDPDSVQAECFATIDHKWNPYYQIELLKQIFK